MMKYMFLTVKILMTAPACKIWVLDNEILVEKAIYTGREDFKT